MVVLAHLNLKGQTGANCYIERAVKLVSAHCVAVRAHCSLTTLMGCF